MTFTSDHRRHVFKEKPQCKSSNAICYLCEKKVSSSESSSELYYHCDGCKSNFHKDCLTVTNPNYHEHTLTFSRRKLFLLLCDICGSENSNKMYGCLQCDFFVHRSCIYLPKVIKITRHPHRLNQIRPTSKVGYNYCGICRAKVRVGYLGYRCIDDKTCKYYTHSNCIVRYNVWDGKYLEGEPEEEVVAASEVVLAPLLDIDGKSKRHFSHDHDLLLEDHEGTEEEVCQACILPTNTYTKRLRCKQCDFALHETCANLPRKMEHGLHRHPVTLHVDTTTYTGNGFFTCSVCDQYSCGFIYKCSIQKDCGFMMDVKCASFVEPFNHSVFRYPFYLGIVYGRNNFSYRCNSCSNNCRYAAQNNIYETFDFKCITLPALLKYKCDDHPLTLDHQRQRYALRLPCGTCEICEESINLGSFYYTCDHCITTLHVECILGRYPYLKSGHIIKVNGFEVEVSSNHGASRQPICHTCHRICPDKQFFRGNDHVCFCSIDCIPPQACS